jgi:hypothetical protein
VNLTNAQNLFAWQIVLEYNATGLNLTGIWIPDDNVFAGHAILVGGPVNDSSHAMIGAALYDGDVVPTVDNGVLCMANFTVTSTSIGAQSLITVAVGSNPEDFWYRNPNTPLLGFYSYWLNPTDVSHGSTASWREHALSSNCTVFTANPLVGDVNGDGVVDMTDIALVAAAFGSNPASPNWNPYADINHDGVVDILDVALVASNFGQHYP